ncbi:Ima1 N-terminal domain-containing protein [Dichotomocladium elegans]|nr:Ima1 N-terminal domain-containing protein [Dichotomocladium elegans]
MAHRQTSWFMLLLGRLNLVNVPVRVTCWYCNQPTELFPGSRETKEYWHCNNCDCINARDKNGEIIDNLPPMHDASLNRPIKPARGGDNAHLISSPEKTICEECQKKLSHIYKVMSEYIPDESDPRYNHYVKTVDDYRRMLDEKYRLCDDCQSKVDTVLAAHKGSFHELRLFETFAWGQSNKAPSKLSREEYQSRMWMWGLLHGLVLLFCAHAGRGKQYAT